MRTTSLAIAAAGALAAVAAGAAVVLTDQAPYPYAQRRVLDLPLPLLTVRRLDDLLRPRPGERVLEIGPGHFDAAYLVTVLGEIPRPAAALAELRRVLKPGGRLVIGEFADRHHLTLTTLMALANEAGLHFVRRTGVPLAYYALLARCPPGP